MGSPFYMAPEQWSDEEPDARADIYSLGVILYQMLGGDVPFKGTGIPSIMKKHLTAAPPTLCFDGRQCAADDRGRRASRAGKGSRQSPADGRGFYLASCAMPSLRLPPRLIAHYVGGGRVRDDHHALAAHDLLAPARARRPRPRC